MPWRPPLPVNAVSFSAPAPRPRPPGNTPHFPGRGPPGPSGSSEQVGTGWGVEVVCQTLRGHREGQQGRLGVRGHAGVGTVTIGAVDAARSLANISWGGWTGLGPPDWSPESGGHGWEGAGVSAGEARLMQEQVWGVRVSAARGWGTDRRPPPLRLHVPPGTHQDVERSLRALLVLLDGGEDRQHEAGEDQQEPGAEADGGRSAAARGGPRGQSPQSQLNPPPELCTTTPTTLPTQQPWALERSPELSGNAGCPLTSLISCVLFLVYGSPF